MPGKRVQTPPATWGARRTFGLVCASFSLVVETRRHGDTLQIFRSSDLRNKHLRTTQPHHNINGKQQYPLVVSYEASSYPSPHLWSDVRQASWTSTALLLPRLPKLRWRHRQQHCRLEAYVLSCQLVAVGADYAHIPEPQSPQLVYRTRPCESKMAKKHRSNRRCKLSQSSVQ